MSNQYYSMMMDYYKTKEKIDALIADFLKIVNLEDALIATKNLNGQVVGEANSQITNSTNEMLENIRKGKDEIKNGLNHIINVFDTEIQKYLDTHEDDKDVFVKNMEAKNKIDKLFKNAKEIFDQY